MLDYVPTLEDKKQLAAFHRTIESFLFNKLAKDMRDYLAGLGRVAFSGQAFRSEVLAFIALAKSFDPEHVAKHILDVQVIQVHDEVSISLILPDGWTDYLKVAAT